MAIHEIVTSVSLIKQYKNGSQIGTATGFFYTKNDEIYLVTNRHVFKDEQKKCVPDILELLLHTDRNNVSLNSTLYIPLYSGNTSLWLTHSIHVDADIAAIHINQSDLNQFFYFAFSKSSFLPVNFPLHPGEDIFIMGYPHGLYDTSYNLPIFRNAMIASSYRVPFQGKQMFLTDANLHPGMSGSPVLTKPKSSWVDQEGNMLIGGNMNYYLIGVHSATLSISADTFNQPIQMGLGASWYAELIESLLP